MPDESPKPYESRRVRIVRLTARIQPLANDIDKDELELKNVKDTPRTDSFRDKNLELWNVLDELEDLMPFFTRQAFKIESIGLRKGIRANLKLIGINIKQYDKV
jgi:hypothetical protein